MAVTAPGGARLGPHPLQPTPAIARTPRATRERTRGTSGGLQGPLLGLSVLDALLEHVGSEVAEHVDPTDEHAEKQRQDAPDHEIGNHERGCTHGLMIALDPASATPLAPGVGLR